MVTAERIRTIIGQLGPARRHGYARTPADNIQADSVPSDNFARRLYRNPDGAKLGGVCNGIATYFRVDPTLVRLIFCSPLLILVCISVIPFLNMFCGFFGVLIGVSSPALPDPVVLDPESAHAAPKAGDERGKNHRLVDPP